MILTCPACATSYFVPDEAIGPNGRRVRCKACRHDWRATLEDAPLELEPEPAPAEDAAGGYDAFAETPAPELPRAFRAKAEQKRRLRRAATQGAAWAALAVVLAVLLGAAFLFRLAIVERFPRAAAAYELFGIEVNIVGLDFEATGARVARHDPGKVLISGALRNIREGEVTAPPVRVVLRDAQGAEVASRVVRLDGPPVLPGQVRGFAVLIADPERKATGIATDFVLTPPPRVGAAEKPATAQGEGLRRISAHQGAPLDIGSAERLSALYG